MQDKVKMAAVLADLTDSPHFRTVPSQIKTMSISRTQGNLTPIEKKVWQTIIVSEKILETLPSKL